MEKIVVTGACILTLLIVVMKGKAEWLLNFVMRCILGVIAIYFVNKGLNSLGISSMVGVNLITVLTSGILGFPGLVALYGIGFYKNL